MLINWQDILQRLTKAQVELEPSAHLTTDSRAVQTGDVFIALKGLTLDGACFVEKALTSGASAVLVDSACDLSLFKPRQNVLVIEDLAESLGTISAEYYQTVSAQNIPVIGVTGTNGKTSITHMLAQISQHCLHAPTAVIGTMGNGNIANLSSTQNTTPAVTEVHTLLNTFAKQEYKGAAMEVSSHALEQGRISGVNIHTAVFTNLTLDHLDYHGSMEAYFEAKCKLFQDYEAKYAVVNLDDKYGSLICDKLPEHTDAFVYGFSEQVKAYENYVFIQEYHCHPFGLSLQLEWQFEGTKDQCELQLPIYGAFNCSNLAAVFATSLTLHWPIQALHFSLLKPVPGRLELFVKTGYPVLVVDYAHTPDALEQSMKAVKEHLTGKLLVIFGCGGDRDTSKRPIMAKLAEQYADHIIVTNDNPRTEDPNQIINDIVAGFNSDNYLSVLDRQEAIRQAISMVGEQDAVLIAGKGHETYQVIGTEKIDYDERLFVAKLLNDEVK